MASEVRSATKTIDAVAEIDLIVSISLSHSRSSHFPDSSLTRAGEGLQSITVGRVFIDYYKQRALRIDPSVRISLSSSKVSNFSVVS